MGGIHPFRDLDEIASAEERLVRIVRALPTFYPWSIIPPDGRSFDRVSTIALPVSGGGVAPSPGAETIVTQYMCPLGYDALVLRISNNYLGPAFNPGIPSLIWRIRIGSSIAQSRLVEDYNQIVVEYGTTNQPRTISGIFLSSGQTLLYTVINQDPGLPVGNSQVVCCFAGLRWPQQRERQMDQL